MLTGMICFCAGVIGVAFSAHLPYPAWWWVLFSLPLFLPAARRLRVPLLALLAGLGWGGFHGHQVLNERLPVDVEGRDVIIEGRVTGLPTTDQAYGQPRTRFDIAVTHSRCADPDARPCALALSKLRLNWYAPPALRVGEHWRLRVRLKRPWGQLNPVGFDYQRWLVSRGYDATGYVREAAGNQRLSAPAPWRPGVWRQGIAEHLRAQLADLSHGGLLAALIVGDRSGITPAQWTLFAATGVSHLMVISGLHVGLVGGLVFGLCRALLRLSTLGYRRQLLLAGMGATLAALVYSALAGFSLPTQRALCMFAVGMLGLVAFRQLRPSQLLLLSLTLILLVDPLAPLAAGFWLSFGAVGIILLVVSTRRRSSSALTRWWQLQWSIGIGMVPALAATVGRFTLLGLAANLALIPLFGLLVVPGNFIALFLSRWASDAAASLWRLLDTALGLALDWLQWLSAWGQYGVFTRGLDGGVTLLSSVVAALLLIAPRALPARRLAVPMAVMALLPAPSLRPGEVDMTVTDVGQGLSVLVQTRQHALLYDVGPGWGEGQGTVLSTALPMLEQRGIQQLDLLMLSHGDNDHAGNWQQLLPRLPVARILSGEPARVGGGAAPCRAGQSWQWDQVRFRVLHPSPAAPSANANNRSCVLQIRAAQRTLLISGDIEASAEQSLVAAGRLQPVDVLVAPHHGSNSSSGWELLSATRPRHAIISAGYRNRFGHPHPDVLARYQAVGSEWHNTAASGAITTGVRGGALVAPRHYRDRSQRWWR